MYKELQITTLASNSIQYGYGPGKDEKKKKAAKEEARITCGAPRVSLGKNWGSSSYRRLSPPSAHIHKHAETSVATRPPPPLSKSILLRCYLRTRLIVWLFYNSVNSIEELKGHSDKTKRKEKKREKRIKCSKKERKNERKKGTRDYLVPKQRCKIVADGNSRAPALEPALAEDPSMPECPVTS